MLKVVLTVLELQLEYTLHTAATKMLFLLPSALAQGILILQRALILGCIYVSQTSGMK